MKNIKTYHTLILFGLLIGVYPIVYLFVGNSFGLLATKPSVLLSNLAWKTFFYTHIFTGGLALSVGGFQFHVRLRQNKPQLHRKFGYVYVISVLFSGVSSIFISFFATAGWVAGLGFFLLGVIWLFTTLKAYFEARKGNIVNHEIWMIYSYSACFAAVTLRIWMPLLIIVLQDFNIAYRIVAWLCWVPNMFYAYWLTKNKTKHSFNI